MLDIRANLGRVQEAVARACARSGRSPDHVLLIAVSKTMDAERVRMAVAAGVAALGENRVQEAREKIEALGHPVPWHLIGGLQTNKARDAARLFDWIHSVDRLELAQELSRRAHAAERTLNILVQVNLGDEPQKRATRALDLTRGKAAQALQIIERAWSFAGDLHEQFIVQHTARWPSRRARPWCGSAPPSSVPGPR